MLAALYAGASPGTVTATGNGIFIAEIATFFVAAIRYEKGT
jgi:hypothetical protein